MSGYKKKNRRERFMAIMACILAILMILPMVFLVLGNLGYAGAATTSQIQSQINDLRAKNKDLSGQKSKLKNELAALGAEKDKALDRKRLLEQQIAVLEEEIDNLEAQLDQYAALIAEKEVEVAENEAKERAQFELFCKQVRAMEEEGTVSYWSILLSAQSFTELLDRVEMVNNISDYNQKVCDQLQIARAALQQAKAQLEEAKAETEVLKAQQEEAKADLLGQKAEVQTVINDIKSNEKLTQQAIDELNAAAKAMDAEIAKKEKELQAAIEAARKSGGNAYQFDPGTGYYWPLPSNRVTVNSFFGPRSDPFTGKKSNHSGTDIGAPTGTEIYAAHGGVVLTSEMGSGSNWSYGNFVVISRGDGVTTLYAHMSKRAVKAGDTVSQGQLIGYVGTTGRSTGPHLHFEVLVNGTRQDALKYYPNVNWVNNTGFKYK